MRTRPQRRMPIVFVAVVLAVVGAALPSTSAGPAPGDGSGTAQGYWLVGAGGAVFGFGDAATHGSASDARPGSAVAGVAPTPSGAGYWLVTADGRIFTFGDAPALGSAGSLPLNKPIVGMAATPTGRGYWFVAADGGVFTFGDAGFYGSTGAMRLNKPIVGLAPTPSGRGYWFVAADGGIFAFGDAGFFGSAGNLRLNQPIVGMAATPTGRGYWFVASDGGVFSYGDARFFGSTGDMALNQPIVGMARTATGGGYWFVAADGGVFNFGDADFRGSAAGRPLTRPITAMAGLPAPTAAADPRRGEVNQAEPSAAPAAGPASPGSEPPPAPPPAPPVTVPAVPFEIALIGDTGYSDSQDRTLLKIRADMASYPLAFVTHDGDIWEEGHPCEESEYRRVHDVFSGFAAPLIYTPGDNEWLDCGSSSTKLNLIRRMFFPTNDTLGPRRFTVARQEPTFVENARWTYGGVVFATLNEPGSDGRSGSHRDANIAWLNAAFDQAEATGAPGVMIIWQDNPFEPSGGRLAKVLKERTVRFGHPVVLVHGDTHRYRIDHPWGDVPNFTRVETHGDTSSTSWVRAVVDPAGPKVFTFVSEKAG